MDSYENLYREHFMKTSAEFRNHPEYPALVEEAASRGFRPITLSEQMDAGSTDAYSWRGGVWVRIAA